jgi:UTP--glucose-1-phosphate uridylyltransferase
MDDPRSTLREALASLDPSVRERLDSNGFKPERLLRLAASLVLGRTVEEAKELRKAKNRMSGVVNGPASDDAMTLPAEGSAERGELEQRGLRILERGELAFCVLAGGMATRMGGVVKALVEVNPGLTFLDIRLRENLLWQKRVGKKIPFWLMTSDATDHPVREALAERRAGDHVVTFEQDLSLRLNPDGTLFRGPDGLHSPYAPGHGDLVDAIRRSNLLRKFRAAGGKYLLVTNLDNLGATIDPVLLGTFERSGSECMVEVVDKEPGDRGGIPVRVDGKLQVLEEFRLPADFDASAVRVFNTNTFWLSAEALETRAIDFHWFEVEKTVDGRPAIQFERLLQELTGALETVYVRVPREGKDARFLPVKDREELERRRNQIVEVVRTRGILD